MVARVARTIMLTAMALTMVRPPFALICCPPPLRWPPLVANVIMVTDCGDAVNLMRLSLCEDDIHIHRSMKLHGRMLKNRTVPGLRVYMIMSVACGASAIILVHAAANVA